MLAMVGNKVLVLDREMWVFGLSAVVTMDIPLRYLGVYKSRRV